MNKAPWTDFNGNAIYEGDRIVHPSGQNGIVKYYPERVDVGDQWTVAYTNDTFESRLCLQVGQRGQACRQKGIWRNVLPCEVE